MAAFFEYAGAHFLGQKKALLLAVVYVTEVEWHQ